MQVKYPDLSPYNFVLNTPLIAVDPDGKDVIIILYNSTNENYVAAAETRKREIESSKGFDSKKDHVYMMEATDLAKLKDQVKTNIDDATNNGYGKTVELSYYGHGGIDGPFGSEETSKNQVSKYENEKFQMTAEGWAEINFNYAPTSIANFYGCQTTTWAQRYVLFSGAKYSSGYGSKVGDTENPNKFETNLITSDGDDIYLWDGVGLDIYKKPITPYSTVNGDIPDASNDNDWEEYKTKMTSSPVSSGVFSTNVSVEAVKKTIDTDKGKVNVTLDIPKGHKVADLNTK
jgi:hypothetical protein